MKDDVCATCADILPVLAVNVLPWTPFASCADDTNCRVERHVLEIQKKMLPK